ncbi:hypothetical protein ACHAW6_003534 [Cyclotella cf. meneghiniana]
MDYGKKDIVGACKRWVIALAPLTLTFEEQTDKKGGRYYSYILCYFDDLLVVHHNPKQVMDRINSFLLLKPDSVGPPNTSNKLLRT